MFHTVKLSKSDPTPIYIQLANELAKLIQANLLCEGMKLPTIRLLSKRLSINRDTVVSAYKLLEKQGLVESHIGKGTYICVRPSNLNPTTENQCSDSICCSHLKFSSYFYPPNLCELLTSHIVKNEGWEAFSDPFYREKHTLQQISHDFLDTIDIHAHFSQIKIIDSINDFLLALFKLFPKIGVCVENIRDLYASCYLHSIGARIYEIPLVEDGLDLCALEKQLKTGLISFILLSPYFHNPTNLCYSLENKKKILQLATQYDVYIIENGTYCNLINMPKYLPLYTLCEDERIIYLYHFSKIYLPYLSYSFAVLPTSLTKLLSYDISCKFSERCLHYYLQSDSFKKVNHSIKMVCKQRYLYFIERLKHFSPLIKPLNATSGLWVWCSIDPSLYTDLCHTFIKKGIIIAPGDLFSTSPLPYYIRFSITHLSLHDIDELIDCIAYYFHQNTLE